MLDTHVLLWFDRHDPALGHEAIAKVTDAVATDAFAVSAISLLLSKRRVVLRLPVEQWRRDFVMQGTIELPITGAIGIIAVQLRNLHPDPADRLIGATVRDVGATLLTADEKILAWPGRLDRRDARL